MYKLIYKPTGNCMKEYDSWRTAQEECGLLIDDGVDTSYKIEHYNKKLMGEYELKDFVARTQPGKFDLNIPKDKKPGKDLECERFHNLDDRETAEVLKYTPTGALIGELARRAGEYESTVDNIYKLLDSMKIYDIKH